MKKRDKREKIWKKGNRDNKRKKNIIIINQVNMILKRKSLVYNTKIVWSNIYIILLIT